MKKLKESMGKDCRMLSAANGEHGNRVSRSMAALAATAA